MGTGDTSDRIAAGESITEIAARTVSDDEYLARHGFEIRDGQCRRVEAPEKCDVARNPPPSEPLILRYPGSGVFYVQTATGDFVPADTTTLRSEIAQQGHEAALWDVSGDTPRPIRPNELFDRYGRRIDTIIYDLTRSRSSFEPSEDGGGELVIASAQRPTIPAVYHADVDRWLRLLAGPMADRLLDWLATCADLTWPTSAPYLYDAKGAGKGMFADGVARLWGRQVTSYDKAIGRFNGELRRSPVVLLDEGCSPPEAGSAAFRSLVAQTAHNIEEKHRPPATLRGAIRLIIAANNMDALRLRESLTAEDEAAIGERILFIRIPSDGHDGTEAGAYLRQHGGRNFTSAWVEDPDTGEAGAIPQHVEWLAAHRKVQRGDRFAVPGETGAWLRNAGLRGGLAQEILAAIAQTAAGAADHWNDDARPVWFVGGDALVNVSRLFTGWKGLTGQDRAPSLARLGSALNVLSIEEVRVPSSLNPKRPRAKRIPGGRVLEVADLLGIGDPDRIGSRIGGKGSDSAAQGAQ